MMLLSGAGRLSSGRHQTITYQPPLGGGFLRSQWRKVLRGPVSLLATDHNLIDNGLAGWQRRSLLNEVTLARRKGLKLSSGLRFENDAHALSKQHPVIWICSERPQL